MLKKTFFLLFSCSFVQHLFAQTFVFRMELFGDSAGLSTITKTHEKNGTDIYILDSHIRAKILWIVRQNHTHYEARYKDGKLISAQYYEENNGKKDKWNYISYDGKEYKAEGSKGKRAFTEVPTHSIGTLYCDGYSKSQTRFFYEPEADFNELKFPEDNLIEFKSSEGNRNVYHFKNGEIAAAEFHTTLATVKLVRIR